MFIREVSARRFHFFSYVSFGFFRNRCFFFVLVDAHAPNERLTRPVFVPSKATENRFEPTGAGRKIGTLGGRPWWKSRRAPRGGGE